MTAMLAATQAETVPQGRSLRWYVESTTDKAGKNRTPRSGRSRLSCLQLSSHCCFRRLTLPDIPPQTPRGRGFWAVHIQVSLVLMQSPCMWPWWLSNQLQGRLGDKGLNSHQDSGGEVWWASEKRTHFHTWREAIRIIPWVHQRLALVCLSGS